MSEDVSKTGVWIDSRTGKIVESEPEEGVQLAAPGQVVDPTTAAQIEALRKPAPISEEPVDLSVPEPKPAKAVTTATTEAAPVKSDAKGRKGW